LTGFKGRATLKKIDFNKELISMNQRIALACTKCLSRNYTTTKNKFKHPKRLEISKFCKKCAEHTLHRETR